MPVILKEEDEYAWLNPDTVEIDQLQSFLKPYASRSMSAYPVSKKVNSPAYDRQDIIQELKGELNSA
jgi:putative SOS response-associated peptidase YedK